MQQHILLLLKTLQVILFSTQQLNLDFSTAVFISMGENFPRPLKHIQGLDENGLFGFEDHYQEAVDQHPQGDYPDHGNELNPAGEIHSLR